MSIGSIGSIRGALGSADAQPSPLAPRVNPRGTDRGNAIPSGTVEASGSGSIPRGAAPWAAWPPYSPPAPDSPLPGGPIVIGLLPPSERPKGGESPSVPAIPLPEDSGSVVASPLPRRDHATDGDVPTVPTVPSYPVPRERTAIIASPLPPPDRAHDDNAPAVPAIPLPRAR